MAKLVAGGRRFSKSILAWGGNSQDMADVRTGSWSAGGGEGKALVESVHVVMEVHEG